MPWAVGNYAVPEQAGVPAAVPIAVAAALPVRVMVVFDYARWKGQDQGRLLEGAAGHLCSDARLLGSFRGHGRDLLAL